MPGGLPLTSTLAMNNQTAGYALSLANESLEAVRQVPALLQGLNTYRGGSL